MGWRAIINREGCCRVDLESYWCQLIDESIREETSGKSGVREDASVGAVNAVSQWGHLLHVNCQYLKVAVPEDEEGVRVALKGDMRVASLADPTSVFTAVVHEHYLDLWL